MDLLLKQNELVDLGADLRGVSVHCQAGCCWLTQAGDSRDIILHAGHSHTINRPGKVLVMATETTRLQLLVEAKQERVSSPWKQLWVNR